MQLRIILILYNYSSSAPLPQEKQFSVENPRNSAIFQRFIRIRAAHSPEEQGGSR